MRAYATVLSLFVLSLSVHAAETARGSSGFITDEDDILVPVANAAAPKTPRCVPSRAYKESTPFKVHVDQIKQTATVTSPDFPEPLTFQVSTGGATITRRDGVETAAKIPNPKSKVAPYCPRTNQVPNVAGGEEDKPKIVTAFETSEFAGRKDCSEEEVRGRSTVFPGNSYKSGQFDAIMPNAIRFRGGQFFHRCPTEAACKALGQPISGECVRVPGWSKAPGWVLQAAREGRLDATAIAYKENRYQDPKADRLVIRREIEISETLVKQMRKYGAIEVTMSEPPPMRPQGTKFSDFPYPTRLFCDDVKDIEIAKRFQAEGIEPEGGWSLGDFFGSMFSGGGTKPSAPVQQTPANKARNKTWSDKGWSGGA